jgi:HK97 family phage major capsid protein
VTYDDLNEVLGKVEQGDFFAEANIRVLAHPAYRQTLRGIKDGEGRPIFIETTDTGLAGAQARATLFGHQVMWSLGARTSAEATDAPEGNPLLIIANANFLALGVRSGPESATSGADEGIGFLTDTAAIKIRSRRAFAVTQEHAVAVLEDTSA